MEFLKDLAFPTVALIIGSIMLLLSIVKRVKTKLIELPEIKTQQQRIQMGVVGVLLIIASFALQFFNPATESETPEEVPVTAAQSTIYAMQTQMESVILTSTTIPTITTPLDPTQTTAQSVIASQIPTNTPVPPTIAIVPTSLAAEEYCVNFAMVSVRSGPDMSFPQMSILENRNNLSNPVCLNFDFRMPDNSWARIAPEQDNSDYSQYEGGWLMANQLRPPDVEVLKIYVPDGVLNGKYCVMNRNGVNIRACSNDSCSIIDALTMRDCLIVDGRSEDNQWIRISEDQEEDKYSQYTGYWINSYYMAPFEFSLQYNSYIRYYLDLLPIVLPIPTPSG